MKTRQGFVSNSSSSSFIVIDASNGYGTFDVGWRLIVGDKGDAQFGWDNIKYDNIFDRINFAYIQTNYGEDVNQLTMLEEVLKENAIGLTTIHWGITDSYDDKDKVWGYIDHQSARCEGQNMEMFDSKQILKDFIFGKNSYIQGGNDNE